MSEKRLVCIHGHFYQPPRENPWLEKVEVQDSAYPYHDWNRRITEECYRPNTASRILGPQDRIVDIMNNYSRISFDFGPTLLSWLEEAEPSVYNSIIEADKESARRFGGHGSAMAQCYNHMIMPLANPRDKRTQIIWGIKDFEHRFGRPPEGMWLPETAVDIATLEAMADNGISFTILSQHQAKRYRVAGESQWTEVRDGRIDPKVPYRVNLPSGKDIAVFLYDMSISKDVAFGSLLRNGEAFAWRLLGAFTETGSPQLVNIATDGESYGHHHKLGDMALSYCAHYISSRSDTQLTNYAHFLSLSPPRHEVDLTENSSWSCQHGIERWRDDCGCYTGTRPDWRQQWRGPLRKAMDEIAQEMDRFFEEALSLLFYDPWEARDDYISVVLDRSEENVDAFLDAHGSKKLSSEDRIRALQLLEMQRSRMLMYTSCGWFFDEISRIEGIQVLNYASRAIQLYERTSGRELEGKFVRSLSSAKSNIPAFENGSLIYERFVRPTKLDLTRVCAHYAVYSLFGDRSATTLYCYHINPEHSEMMVQGKRKLSIGKVRIRSQITREEGTIGYAVLHLGDHNIVGGLSEDMAGRDFDEMREKLTDSFERADVASIVRSMDGFFPDGSFSLWHLFRDEQRSILLEIVKPSLDDLELIMRNRLREYLPVISMMRTLNHPLPHDLMRIVELVLNRDIQDILMAERLDIDELHRAVRDYERTHPQLDRERLLILAKDRILALMNALEENPEDERTLEEVIRALELLSKLGMDITFWEAQNTLLRISRENRSEIVQRIGTSRGAQARRWLDLLETLGNQLGVKVSP